MGGMIGLVTEILSFNVLLGHLQAILLLTYCVLRPATQLPTLCETGNY